MPQANLPSISGDIPHVAHCTAELFELCQKPAVLALVTIQVRFEK
jgi:hypothetical protein